MYKNRQCFQSGDSHEDASFEIELRDVGFGACFAPQYSHDIHIKIGLDQAYNPLSKEVVSCNPFHTVTALPRLQLHSAQLDELWSQLESCAVGDSLAQTFLIHQPGTSMQEVRDWMLTMMGKPSSKLVASESISFHI